MLSCFLLCSLYVSLLVWRYFMSFCFFFFVLFLVYNQRKSICHGKIHSHTIEVKKKRMTINKIKIKIKTTNYRKREKHTRIKQKNNTQNKEKRKHNKNQQQHRICLQCAYSYWLAFLVYLLLSSAFLW